MEYISEETLFDYIAKHQDHLDETTAQVIFSQLCDALTYLHRNNVCHRDIKLQNIMIDENLNIKLIDFGHSVIQGS